jgi:hypothetical protein
VWAVVVCLPIAARCGDALILTLVMLAECMHRAREQVAIEAAAALQQRINVSYAACIYISFA